MLELDTSYTYPFSKPYILEIDGIRYGFLTCYDFYFYEAVANMAKQNIDIIIGCALQRSDSHDAIEMMCKFAAYNTNAYVIRSSVSLQEENVQGARNYGIKGYVFRGDPKEAERFIYAET